MVDLAILGLDGLDGRLMQKWLNTDVLPEMTADLNDNTFRHKRVDSWKTDDLTYPFTPQAWPAIYQGGPMDHPFGVEFEDGDATNYWTKTFTFNFTTEIGPTIFDDLSHAGYTLNSFRMPMTFPAGHINGWMVSGFPAGKDGDGINPREIDGLDADTLPANYPAVRSGTMETNADPTLTDHLLAEDDRYQIFAYLTDKTDADVVCYGTQLIDKLGHLHRQGDAAGVFDDATGARKGYRKIDCLYRRIIDAHDPTYVIGISDHGFSGSAGGESGGHSYHSMDASCFLYARNGDVGALQHVSRILDFRAVVCELMGASYTLTRFNPDQQAEWADDDRRQLKKRLRAMGYI